MELLERCVLEDKYNPMKNELDELNSRRESGRQGGGAARIEQQHSRGKLTARERIILLMDDGEFTEIDSFVTHRAVDFGMKDRKIAGDAVVTGYGKIAGKQVFVYSQDFTVLGGSLSEVVGEKICKIMDMAAKTGCPVVGINDSGGARIQEGTLSLAAYGEIFLRNTLYSGVIPQISVIMGPSAGGAVYSPAITDFIFMVQGTGQMYITGPDVVKTVTGVEVDHETLGGYLPHSTKSGVAHFVGTDEEDCLQEVRKLINFLPVNNTSKASPKFYSSQTWKGNPKLRSIIPPAPNKPYDMKDIIYELIDDEFMEVQKSFARNIIVGFGRMNGNTVGIVANQPDHLAGVLDIDASTKASRFVRFCDCFNIPLVTLIDVPGFMPGVDQEYGGIIRHGAKLIYAYAEATVPKISVITRKAYGGAYIVMSSKHLRSDVNFAWPSAEIAVMGPEGAVNIIHRNEIASAGDQSEQVRFKLIQKYRESISNPYVSAERGFLDDVIDPADTRSMIIKSLDMLKDKSDVLPNKKHGNIPL